MPIIQTEEKEIITSLLSKGLVSLVPVTECNKKNTSAAWQHFRAIKFESLEELDSCIETKQVVIDAEKIHVSKKFVACKECKHLSIHENPANGTSHFNRHITNCQRNKAINTIDSYNEPPAKKIRLSDQHIKEGNERLIDFITIGLRPTSLASDI